MPRGTLEIAVYKPPAPANPVHIDSATFPASGTRTGLRTSSNPTSRYTVAATGAFLSLLLHVFLFSSLTYSGGHDRMLVPKRADPGAMGTQIPMELEIIEDADSSMTTDEAEVIAPTLMPVSLGAALTIPNIPLAQELLETRTAVEKTESAARSTLVGRYLGQIDARIERAWRRPRNPIDEGVFSCQVRIEQDALGDVKEITLERCNGDVNWQVSLVHAIQAASPLPAPPDPKVFKRVIRMGFRSEPYSAQALQDAYEPAHQ